MAEPIRRRPRGWLLIPAAAPLVLGLFYLFGALGDGWGGVQTALYCSANVTMGLAAAVAARRHRRVRAGLLLIAASSATSVFADVVFYHLAFSQGTAPYPSIADAGYLAAYPLLAAGLLIIVRRRTPGWDGASLIDATIVATGVGFIVYALVITPTIQVGGNNVATLVSVLYPIGDLMLISVGARLMLGAGYRTMALAALGAYLALTLYADTVYSVQSLAGTYVAGSYLDAFWVVASFVLAAGVLHPSFAGLVAPAPAKTPDATAGRLLVLAAAALVSPTTLLMQHLRGAEPPIVSATLVCNVLFLLVLARMAGLVRAQRRAAITDGLTGLYTRRYLSRTLQTEVARVARSGAPLGMLLLDIDHFKTVNDAYGHHGGDAVLVEVAARMRRLVRDCDVIARYGGEEFAVIAPGASLVRTAELAERIRRGLAAAPIDLGAGRRHKVTASIGVAVLRAGSTDPDELIVAADRALYAAKNSGRDRVVSAPMALVT